MDNQIASARTPSPPYGVIEPFAITQSILSGKHDYRSGAELAATLSAASRENGTTGTSLHPQPKTMLLGPSANIRLVSTLRHI